MGMGEPHGWLPWAAEHRLPVFLPPGRRQNPSESHGQSGSFLILLAIYGYPLWLVRGGGLLAATPLFRVCAALGMDHFSGKRLDFIAELVTHGSL